MKVLKTEGRIPVEEDSCLRQVMYSGNYRLLFAFCFRAIDPKWVLAQTANPIRVGAETNYSNIEWFQISFNELTDIVKGANPSRIPSNAWGIILQKVDWFQLPTNVQYYISENVDWSMIPTELLEFYNHPGAWPESPEKEPALRHCAVLLRSSVDTNWLAMVASKLANEPAVLEFTNHLYASTYARQRQPFFGEWPTAAHWLVAEREICHAY
jgi:hypothetical protein